MSVNEKTFSLFTKTQKVFSLVLTSFDYAITLIARIFMRMPISFVSSVQISLSQIFNLKRIRIVISQVKLRINLTEIFNLKQIRLVTTLKARVKAVATITQRLIIGFTSKAIQKVISNIILKKIVFSFSPTLATFYTLGYFDPSTLATMDTETLEELDYLIA
jgi:hypothetical protein